MTVVEESPAVPEIDVPEFMVGHELMHCENLDTAEYVHDNIQERVESPDDANLISSKISGSRKHRVILDIDFPAALIPSSTPGHFHLYLDKELTEDQMERLVFTLHDVGIIAQGNRNQWDRFRALFLRLPWVKKNEDSAPDTPKEVAAMEAAGRRLNPDLNVSLMAPF